MVNPRPLPKLGTDLGLCAGTQAILDPGTFTTYLWQDMSSSRTFTVSTPGLYWVTVTNEFNCQASDSFVLNSILPSPDGFLKKTDSICVYQNLALAATGTFEQYVWSTGAETKQIQVNTPGTYLLTVTDANGCKGTNQIDIYPRNCMPEGVYLPTAFTPNHDGKNDIFKAQVFGKIISSRLQVFSREGMMVFQTSNPHSGWDGSYKGIPCSAASFVYKFTFQLENKQPEFRTGTVTLIR